MSYCSLAANAAGFGIFLRRRRIDAQTIQGVIRHPGRVEGDRDGAGAARRWPPDHRQPNGRRSPARIAEGRLGAFGCGNRYDCTAHRHSRRLPHVAQPVAPVVGAGERQHILLVVAVNPSWKPLPRRAGWRIDAETEQRAIAQAVEPGSTLAIGE